MLVDSQSSNRQLDPEMLQKLTEREKTINEQSVQIKYLEKAHENSKKDAVQYQQKSEKVQK